MNTTLHPQTIDFASFLAGEYRLLAGCWCADCFPSQDFEHWYRAKWDVIASGEISEGHAFEHGVGYEATALYVEQTLHLPDEADQQRVLGWLGDWLEERRAAVTQGADESCPT